jgi:quinol monooxygenase YgiN
MMRRAFVATARSGSGTAEMYSSTVACLAMSEASHGRGTSEIHRSMDWPPGREELASLAMAVTAMIVRSEAKPGQRDALRAVWEKHLRAPTDADDSRLLYLYCFDAEDPDAYVLVEVFRDGAGPPPPNAPFFQEFMRDAGPLLDDVPVVQRTEVVWSKGLGS